MHSDLQLSARLCENTIFEGLTPQQIQSILPCIVLSLRTYGSEECVYDKGQDVRELGVVLNGELCVCEETMDGRSKTVSNIEKNELFGDAVVFSTSSKLSHRVIARENAEVAYLSLDFFLSPCGRGDCEHMQVHQEVVKNMLRLLSDRALMLNKKVAYLTASDLRTKIAMYLWELYEMNGSAVFNMPLNRDRLAEFFSVARPSLSRELINLKSQGVIDFHRSSVTILDLAALYEIAHMGEA